MSRAAHFKWTHNVGWTSSRLLSEENNSPKTEPEKEQQAGVTSMGRWPKFPYHSPQLYQGSSSACLYGHLERGVLYDQYKEDQQVKVFFMDGSALYMGASQNGHYSLTAFKGGPESGEREVLPVGREARSTLCLPLCVEVHTSQDERLHESLGSREWADRL